MASTSDLPQLQFFGDPYCDVYPISYAEPETGSTQNPPPDSNCITFLIHVVAEFTKPKKSDDQDEDDDFLFYDAETRVVLSSTYAVPLEVLLNDDEKIAVSSLAYILSELHLPALPFVTEKILGCGRTMMSERRDDQKTLTMRVNLHLFVQELPEQLQDDGDDDYSPNDVVFDEADYLLNDVVFYEAEEEEDEEVIGFVPASQLSIEGLPRVRIGDGLSEKVAAPAPATCSVCFEDVPIGSEAVRLPCSHCYHEDCIVKWLHKSKFCPLCRYEIV